MPLQGIGETELGEDPYLGENTKFIFSTLTMIGEIKYFYQIAVQVLLIIGDTRAIGVRKGVLGIPLTITLRGLSPRANYTDRATAAGRRS